MAQSTGRVFELRTYTCVDGRLDALKTRVRDQTTQLFEKHGMTNIGYWVPQDGPTSKNTLIYVLAHPAQSSRGELGCPFRADPEWVEFQGIRSERQNRRPHRIRVHGSH